MVNGMNKKPKVEDEPATAPKSIEEELMEFNLRNGWNLK